jgi:hypothetical protein
MGDAMARDSNHTAEGEEFVRCQCKYGREEGDIVCPSMVNHDMPTADYT